jgi:hypothetical protein
MKEGTYNLINMLIRRQRCVNSTTYRRRSKKIYIFKLVNKCLPKFGLEPKIISYKDTVLPIKLFRHNYI